MIPGPNEYRSVLEDLYAATAQLTEKFSQENNQKVACRLLILFL